MAVEDNTEGRAIMTSQQCSYLAGLLDGDGSIMLQLKPRKEMIFLFRIKALVVIYQDTKQKDIVEKLWKLIGAGYFSHRNDHISEIRIEGFSQVERFIKAVQPFACLKEPQIRLMLKALFILKKKNYTIHDFLKVCSIADEISAHNYSSKRRIYTYAFVKSELEKHNLLPVTTEVSKLKF